MSFICIVTLANPEKAHLRDLVLGPRFLLAMHVSPFGQRECFFVYHSPIEAVLALFVFCLQYSHADLHSQFRPPLPTYDICILCGICILEFFRLSSFIAHIYYELYLKDSGILLILLRGGQVFCNAHCHFH